MKILITGASNGMGRGVANALAEYRAENNELILLCRSEALGLQTIAELQAKNRAAEFSLVLCDLSDMDSVRRAVLEIKDRHSFLDSIFINAGIGYAARQLITPDGMDSHFQVNYLSQFYLVLQLLDLLEKSDRGGRVIFNATPGGRLNWDDLQMTKRWDYETAIHQAMVAKRMFLQTLHDSYRTRPVKVSFIGFSIHKTVWSNQINLIPRHMKAFASVMKALGLFISVDECGRVMAPLFLENFAQSIEKSGALLTWKKKRFSSIAEDAAVKDEATRKKLFELSLQLCKACSVQITDSATSRV
ncbi:MAG: SDR family NAD(P)-dependent oxidoreductase [Spirochaetes bacterium]|nr:SDR family NAD(P)-dependent oxidoreductase [Spirochaetota bacterium]MBU0956889.1 SDR family NAD(P)-dependent oxidoreductase [Spirochaetota bacterium]